jgi:hypothetical protein
MNAASSAKVLAAMDTYFFAGELKVSITLL